MNFKLEWPESPDLTGCAVKGGADKKEWLACPLNPQRPAGLRHNCGRRIWSESLLVEVKHNKRVQTLIRTWGCDVVIHESLATEFERHGITGYRMQPAAVRFRDGSLCHNYKERIATGWAGVARAESGIHVAEDCPACFWKHYTPLQDPEQLIDWSQWTGEDFFRVWPLPNFVLITKRVVELLQALTKRG